MSKSTTSAVPTDDSEQHAQTDDVQDESGDDSPHQDIDRETLYDPGLIRVSDPEHRRLLEDVGKADEWRVVFIGDAAEGDDDE